MATAGATTLVPTMPLTLDAVRDVLNTDPDPMHTPGVRRAAVAMLLDDRMDMLLMQRAVRAGDPWSGHLSFPGGHVDAGDRSDLHAAIEPDIVAFLLVREAERQCAFHLSPV